MKRSTYLTLLLPLSLLSTADTIASPSDKPKGFSRQNLFKQSVTLPSPTIETQVIKVHFPPGYKTPVHTHEGPGPRYVLKGQLRIEDNGETHIYKEGQVFWESGSEMTVENVGSREAEILIFQMMPPK